MLHFITTGLTDALPRKMRQAWRGLCRRLRRDENTGPRDAIPVTFGELRIMPAKELRARLAGDQAEAARWVLLAAHHGLPEAQLALGQMLLDGHGVRHDRRAAMRWFRRAADAGLAEAMNMVGRCHERGWGVAADPSAAASWYRRAADRGLDWGQYNLANLLLHGIGVTRDRPAAYDLYRRAADQGHAKSMNLMGRILEEGWDVRRDPARALAWYHASAKAGDFRGQYNLATMLIGLGRAAEGREWFRAAIDGGSPDFLLDAGKALADREEPDLKRLGYVALSRAAGALPEMRRPA